VLDQPFPHFFFELDAVPLGDPLLDSADQDGGGVHAGDVGRLVGGEQRDALLGELLFQP
jgi:hypothetical protein